MTLLASQLLTIPLVSKQFCSLIPKLKILFLFCIIINSCQEFVFKDTVVIDFVFCTSLIGPVP